MLSTDEEGGTVVAAAEGDGDATAAKQEEQRVLKGVMRVGLLAKHLLLKSDKQVQFILIDLIL